MKRSLLDRTVGFFSPSAELKRLRSRMALEYAARSFEGASTGRRTKNWSTTNASVNALLAQGIPTLRARSRDLIRNNPWAGRAVAVIQSNTVGSGIIPQTRTDDKKLEQALENLWIQWGDEVNCDADERLDFYGIQALVMRTVVESGSCLIRRRRRRLSDGLPVPIQLQVMEPDYLDTRILDKPLPNGGRIQNGIEFDALGQRAAYYLYNQHPGNTGWFLPGLESKRVPASEIIHVYRVERPGQIDGIPWATPVLLRTRDLDEYEDAQLIRQKIAACYTAFIHDVEAMDDIAADADAVDRLERLEPGTIEILPPGKEVSFGNPPAAEGYGDHTRSVLRSIAMGFGITYEALTGDLSQVNFSSARMGWLEFQRNLDQWRNAMLVPQLCKGVWSWFVEAANMAGLVDGYASASWTSPRREMIDPTRETEALKGQVRSGFIPLSEAIRQGGRDPDEVLSEIASDNSKLDALGLTLDCDPRKSAGTSTTAAVDSAVS